MIKKLKIVMNQVLNRSIGKFTANRLDISKDDENYDIDTKKIINLLNFAKKSGFSYTVINFPAI